MERMGVVICCFDDQHPDELTHVAAFTLPATDVQTLQPETALDDLEATTQRIGQAILRRTLQAQWALIDQALVHAYCRDHAAEEITGDGQGPITVASRCAMSNCPARC